MKAASSPELYEFLKSTCVDGLPYMKSDLFAETTETWGRDIFRSTLAEFVTNEKPDFPYKKIEYNDLQKNFYRLSSVDYSTYIHPVEQQKKEVLEKYDDYKYSYADYGMGLINAPSTFNEASDYFHNEGRMDCGSYGFTSPVSRWTSGNNIWGVFGPIWRGVNDSWHLTPETYMMAFRLGTYIATQFKPIVAKCVYGMTDAKRVLDTSMGWGDRLCGFFASNASVYIGCDPNPNTFEIYKQQAKVYSAFVGNTYTIQEHEDFWSLIGDKKTCYFYRCGAEDLPWDTICDIDCAFTSPPYFSTERYNEGGEHSEDQSWSKFSEYESWRDDFYLPVSQKTFDSLRSGGHMWINIMDPKIKGTRYFSSDELVDMLSDSFTGQIGMRIMQRPQGKSVFSDENGEFDKEQLEAFMNKTYIENVWCFQKDKNDFDVFRHKKSTSLDDFL